MCRMMAVITKEGIQSKWLVPFESLAAQGKIRCDMIESGHHDGWGLVSYFQNNFPKYLFREIHSISKDSEHFKSSVKYLEQAKCKTVLAHLRKTSVGQVSISNTHPFLYKEWSFAHNGTIFNHDTIPLQLLKPAGTTDSERFFLYLMERIGHINPKNEEILFEELKKAVEVIKKEFRYSSLTFLLSNGHSVFALRECDPQYQDYYTLFRLEIGDSKIICSEPLAAISGSWESVENGSFLKV